VKDTILVNQIIPFSNVDGDGNRLSIFVQGCNLNCVYCHNSETISLCNNCGVCVEICPAGALNIVDGIVHYNKKLCVSCDGCIRICPHQSTPKAQYYNKRELLEMIGEYRSFLRGITVSGGEPTLYHEFIRELFIDVKKLGLSCYIDSNGFFDASVLDDLIGETDGFLLDIKAVDKQDSICGFQSSNPLNNLKSLLKLGKIAEVRTVIVSEYMDSENTVKTVAQLISEYPHVCYKLIRVHTVGLKQEQKEKIKNAVPSTDYMEKLEKLANNEGALNIKIIR